MSISRREAYKRVFFPQKQTLCINQLFDDKLRGLLLLLGAGENGAAELSLSWQECLDSQHGTVHAQATSTLQHELHPVPARQDSVSPILCSAKQWSSATSLVSQLSEQPRVVGRIWCTERKTCRTALSSQHSLLPLSILPLSLLVSSTIK